MGKKFNLIYESVTARMTSGGYLPGDTVVFRNNYKSCECYKALPTKIQKDLDEMVKSGLNIKITQVGDNLSGASANNQNKLSSNMVITVAADHGGGRYYSAITVSPDMIDLAESDGVNLPKIPDQFRRDDKQSYKPEKYQRDPKFITNVSDKGDGKNTPTNLKLAGESTMLRNDMANLANLYMETFNWENPYKDDVKQVRKRQFGNDVDEHGKDSALNSRAFQKDRSDGTKPDRPFYGHDRNEEGIKFADAPNVFKFLMRDLGLSKNLIEIINADLLGKGDRTISAQYILAEDGDEDAYEYVRDSVAEFERSFNI